MPVAKKIAEAAQHSSWIRQMFEEGARLAATHGSDKVFDFSQQIRSLRDARKQPRIPYPLY